MKSTHILFAMLFVVIICVVSSCDKDKIDFRDKYIGTYKTQMTDVRRQYTSYINDTTIRDSTMTLNIEKHSKNGLLIKYLDHGYNRVDTVFCNESGFCSNPKTAICFSIKNDPDITASGMIINTDLSYQLDFDPNYAGYPYNSVYFHGVKE